MSIQRKLFGVFVLLGWLICAASPALAAPPVLKMLSPVSGSRVSGNQVIQVSVQSSSTVQKVVFYRDNWVAIGTVKVAPYQISFNMSSLSLGSHRLFAAAYTATEAGASNIITVNVVAAAPSPTPTPAPAVSPSPAPSPSPTPVVSPSPTPVMTPTPTPVPQPSPVTSYPQALKMADFILSLQDAGGAIKDGPGGTICNEDSNMEYALLGLAAAYVKTKDPRYLTGFEKGIAWLADREEMNDSVWRGSWYYTYQCSPPYAHVATSPGSGITDVRGVDTTSAYFAYLIYIHKQITKSDAFVIKYADHAKAALDFVLRKNWDPKGLSYSSWQLINGTWKLWTYQYTADQADVFLGLRAGALLYDGENRYYGTYADKIEQNIPLLFYDTKNRRYAEGLEDGGLDWANESDAVFPQGYVPWALGKKDTANMGAYQWMASRVQADGSIVAYTNDPKFSINVAIFGMTANALGQPEPVSSYNWLLSTTYDAKNGGVRDTANTRSAKYSNVAAFTILALLRQSPWNW